MANEIRVQAGLNVVNGNLNHRSSNSAFQADMSGTKGPSPGMINVSQNGTDIDLSELDDPGYCRFHNPGATRTITVGVWDGTNSKFFPVFEIPPGESAVMKLAADIEEEYSGTGTGTSSDVTTLRAKSEGGAGVLIVDAFDR